MKTGKIILNDIICQVSFDENPSITVEAKTNEDGTKELTGYWGMFVSVKPIWFVYGK